MKIIKHFLLTIVVLLCGISVSAHDFEVDGICYNITSSTDKTVGVTYKGTDYFSAASYSGSVVIPKTVNYNGAIYSVTSIWGKAFYGCSGLTSISIPNSVTGIGSSAFYGCSGLTSISIPNSVTSIGDDAFNGCSRLTSISIPNSVTSIGERAFCGCSRLTSISIPNSVTSIGNYAFYGCSGLTSIVIPNGVTSIGIWTFNGCSGLTSISIPNSVTSIGKSAFYGCSGLTSISIPNSVTSIGNSAFGGCSGLTSISIPNSVTSIGKQAFYGTPWYENKSDGVVYINNVLYKYKGSMPNNTSIEIKEGIVSISPDAFYGCSGLTSISIPNSVTSIEDYAFASCKGLTSISIPNSVTSIGDRAFYYCLSLTSISIPNSVTSIGEYAFEYCSGLTSISIPNSVISIGSYAFGACNNLTQIICHATTPPLIDASVFSLDKSKCTLLIPEGTESLYQASDYWKDFLQVETIPVPKLFALIDGETYDNNEEQVMDTITYTRTFNNTVWQALYIPFSMNYSDWAEDFDVAKINDIHQFDEDNDNVLDRTIMEVVKIMGGSLKPNHPYMIRAKSTGTKTITVENATLMPAESNSIDCSSVEREYVFTGTYTGVDGETMVENMYYAMSGGGVKYSTNTSVSLKPFRWYMQIKDRDGQVINDIAEAKVIVRGEEDWDVTDIEDVKTESGKFVIYSIGGTLVRNVKSDNINQATEGLPAGMYIINGKKHFIK